MEYLNYLRDRLRLQNVRIRSWAKALSPDQLVQKAAVLTAEWESDETWVLLDTDDFSADQIDFALTTARKERIHVALSNPCFELWLVWHLRDEFAAVTTRQVQAKAKSLGVATGSGGKSINSSYLAGKFTDARQRAQRIRATHENNGKQPPHDIPSSRVDEFVDAVVSSETTRNPQFGHGL